mmetsp:Transcript_111/g.328  ORF Transcript_111/g.328 Transcript_111/m.328 type:complete len:215 (-) Transcript_111:1191-1835(-)
MRSHRFMPIVATTLVMASMSLGLNVACVMQFPSRMTRRLALTPSILLRIKLTTAFTSRVTSGSSRNNRGTASPTCAKESSFHGWWWLGDFVCRSPDRPLVKSLSFMFCCVFRPVTTHARPTGLRPRSKSSHSGGYTFKTVWVSPVVGHTVGSLLLRSKRPSKNTRGTTPKRVSRTTTYCAVPFVKQSEDTLSSVPPSKRNPLTLCPSRLRCSSS